MYLCADLHMNDSLSFVFRHSKTISSTSRQFLKLFEVIIAWTTELCVNVVVRRGRCGLAGTLKPRESLLFGVDDDSFIVTVFSRRLLLRLRLVDDELASSMLER